MFNFSSVVIHRLSMVILLVTLVTQRANNQAINSQQPVSAFSCLDVVKMNC